MSFIIAHLIQNNHHAKVTGRTWRGTAFGGVKGRTEIPGLVEGEFADMHCSLIWHTNIKATDYLKGALKIDEYVTHNRTLADINEGFHDMHVGRHYILKGTKKN